MASETEVPEQQSLLERLMGSRNRDLSLFLPIILGFTNTTTTTTTSTSNNNPDQETPPDSRESRDRIILVNPLTQGMVVIEGSPSSLDSFLRDLLSKDGQPPASRASVEAMPSAVISEEDVEGGDGECVICLEEWKIGGLAKEMPCKHRFHGDCIEKWLGIHGSCPLCRYKMPVDDDQDLNKLSGGGGGEERGRRREIWVSFSINSERRSGGPNQTPASDSYDSSSTPPRPDHHEIEG
ncbi:E3 ubiquitin-protein ligase MPSR1-like [Cornus florida]|uniref:E3 ubiquitin-protein ligase MPSR1-like n=1 Tax=Cornus florida TaxID=4283 RepID=UPI00289D78E3|nr:E3 ubiquitin-protein ligase MPSR1-like [Cornus florida]